MRPDDEHCWKHPIRSDYRHQPVWSEPKREWRTHPVSAQPVPVSVWVCAEQHDCLSEHGEDWWPAGEPAGVGQQLNSFILTLHTGSWICLFCFFVCFTGNIWKNCKLWTENYFLLNTLCLYMITKYFSAQHTGFIRKVQWMWAKYCEVLLALLCQSPPKEKFSWLSSGVAWNYSEGPTGQINIQT